jgi:hypothetical protein
MGGTVGENVGSAANLHVRILGPFSICREGGAPVPLPRSRKVRALLAFLALGGTSYSRSRLCALLWDVPNDPRGELRWCLSKLRALLDDPDTSGCPATPPTISSELSASTRTPNGPSRGASVTSGSTSRGDGFSR